MKILRDIENIELKSCALAIGNFDGVHIGHQKIMNDLLKYSKQKDIPSVVFSFYNHPLIYINKIKDYYITCPEEKIQLFKEQGIDILIMPDFNESFMKMSPENFIKILKDHLNPQHIIVGKNFNFGFARKGNPQTLIDNFDDKVNVIEQVRYEGIKISSTIIRELLKSGDIKKASTLLGRNFFITSKVRSGKKIGRDLNAPTINFNMDQTSKILPPAGVYISKVFYDSRCSYGISNIGGAPTLDSFDDKCIETHIFDKEIKNMYNKQVKIELLKFLREEIKFDDLSLLKDKISEDIANAKKIINLWRKDETNSNNHYHSSDDDINYKCTRD
ncbi:MAG: hypothetical protein C0601_03165 [Candidatus Muiribacterium halophilum]|uniref:Riboflavin biosynthesis protein n=1 Tax=Muiribacterium halophilum TaxID=2053465 RepID=A0A2N5ZK84_MUIH1|nr:MAG: hypothetical protein C0601_03165 [Candidatus Muirbacterium halophilum]